MSAADVRAGKLLTISRIITEEDNSLQIDGIATLFTVSNNYVAGTLKVYLNGLRQQSGIGNDYAEVLPNQFSVPIAPVIGDIMIVDYIKI